MPQRVLVRSLASITRSISWASATSAGCFDNESVEADTLAGRGADVAEVGVLSRDAKLACPISKGTRKHAARATNEKKSVVLCLDIYFNSSAREQGRRAARTQQLARGGIHLLDIDRGYALTKNQVLRSAGRHIGVGPRQIDQHDDGCSHSRGNMHRPGIVGNKNSQPGLRGHELRDGEFLQNDAWGWKNGAHPFSQMALFRADKNDRSHSVVADQAVGQLRKLFQGPASSGMTRAGKQSYQRRADLGFRFS